MGRTGGGLPGGLRVPTGMRFTAQPSGSSLGPWFWGALHIAAHQGPPADSSGVGLERPRAKLAGRDQPALRPTTLHLSSPLYACLASYRTPRAFPWAPYGNHGNHTPCRCQPNCIRGPKENTVVPPHP